MKIIMVDNYDREAISDALIATGLNKFYGERIVGFLINTMSGGNSSSFYRLVEDDHKLYEFKP